MVFTFIDKSRGIGFLLTKTRLPEEQNFGQFVNLVTQDERVPNESKRENEPKVRDDEIIPEIKGLEGTRIWNPLQIYYHPLTGVALVPKGMLSTTEWIGGCYYFGFQGYDPKFGVYFGGASSASPDGNILKIMTAGENVSKENLERVVVDFLNKTRLQETQIPVEETNDAQAKSEKVIKLLEEHKLIERGGFMYSPIALYELLGAKDPRIKIVRV